MHPKKTFRTSKFVVAALMCIAGGLVSGCIAIVPYTPATNRIQELGEKSAKEKIEEVLTTAVAPHITGAEPKDNELVINYVQPMMGPFYTTTNVPGVVAVLYANLEKVVIYANNKVFIYMRGNQLMSPQIVFRTQEDAKEFADLLMSYREQYMESKNEEK